MLALLFTITTFAADAPKCFSPKDMKNVLCFALCRHDGYDSGFFSDSRAKCLCGAERDLSEMMNPRIDVLSEPPPKTY